MLALLIVVGAGRVIGQEKSKNGAKAVVAKSRPGLASHYYRDASFWGGNWTADFLPKVKPEKWIYSNYLFTRIEPLVNHIFVSRSWFSVRWSGYVTVPDHAEGKAKDVEFFLTLDHGGRLTVDGTVVVDAWMPKRGGCREVSGKISLTPGKHVILLESFVGGNDRPKKGLVFKLLWKSDGYGIKKAVIPANSLTHTDLHLPPVPGRIKKYAGKK